MSHLVSATVLPEGYTLQKCLQNGSSGDVYAAGKESDRRDVILKLYRRRTRAERSDAAKREHEALEGSAGPGVPRALGLHLELDPPVLVLERVPGQTLASWLATHRLEPMEFLEVASRLTEIIARVHLARFIHRDITPWNVLVEPVSHQTHLIDFGLARRLGTAQHGEIGSGAPEAEGTLLYMAPEQTGRMNRGCDFRSDLYGLGATLYHALVGRPPFEAADPLELIHAHIARLPTPPQQLRPDLPEALSRMLLKLLRKDPEDRYQSARGLLADLQAFRRQLRDTGQIESDFEVGKAEAPERPLFSQKLYGREKLMARLHAAFGRAAEGRSQLLMLRGDSGCGKSMLVDQLRAPVAERGGYLAVARFDPYRESAYSGWATLLDSLSQQLLTESDARLARWSEQLRGGLGHGAQALVNLAPHLGFVTGEVPPLPTLGPGETRARLAAALQRFISAFATPEHPLVLFLDDLQWSDSDSRFLLEQLMMTERSAALLLIAAYPSGETEEARPLAALVERWTEREVALELVKVGPLTDEAAAQMLADALGRTREEARALAELVTPRTGNSPLLIRQFTEHLHDQGLLRHEPGIGWTWDPAQVAAARLPDSALALMTAKLEALPRAVRDVLSFASCVGDEFDLELLCDLSHSGRASLARSLDALADEGLIAPCSAGFRFAHGRLREVAQSLLSEAERAQLHYETGRVLLSRIPPEEQATRASEITEHLNRGLAHLTEDLRVSVMQLNLRAGTRALSAGASATASGHLNVAHQLFREEDWSEQRALGFELYMQLAECAFQSRDFSLALEHVARLDGRSTSPLEYAQVELKRMQVLTFLQGPQEYVRYALGVLRELGVRWPLRPSTLRAWLTVRSVAWLLRLRGNGDRLRPAASFSARPLAATWVAGQSGAMMSRLDVRLVILASCRAVRQFIFTGYMPKRGPAFSLSAFAMYFYCVTRDAPQAERIARSALRWNERVPDPFFGPRAEMQVHGLMFPWLMRRRQAVAPLERISQVARETGDLEFSYYSRFLLEVYRALAGDPIAVSERRLNELSELVQRTGASYLTPVRSLEAYRLLLSLPTLAPDLPVSFGPIVDIAEPYVRTVRMLALCVHARYREAFDQSEAARERIFLTSPFVHVTDYCLYRGLAAAVLASTARGWERRRYRRALRECLTHLRGWARGGPDFAHMAALLDAERARLRGNATRARALYESSAQRARQQEFPHHAALAHERCGSLLAEQRRETEAASALTRAAAIYREWGTEAKAEALERQKRILAGS